MPNTRNKGAGIAVVTTRLSQRKGSTLGSEMDAIKVAKVLIKEYALKSTGESGIETQRSEIGTQTELTETDKKDQETQTDKKNCDSKCSSCKSRKKLYLCKNCGAEYQTASGLRRHNARDHREHKHKCQNCNYTVESGRKKQLEKHSKRCIAKSSKRRQNLEDLEAQ